MIIMTILLNLLIIVLLIRLNLKKTLTGKTGNHDKKDAETMVPLKYLRRRQFNLLVYEQDSIKNSFGRQP